MPSHKNTRRYDIWVYFLKPTIRIFICLLSFLNSWDLFHLLRYDLSMWNKFIFWIVSKKPAMRIFIQFFFYYRKVFIVLRYFLLLWKTLVHWILSKKEKEKSGSKVEWAPAKTLKGKFIASEARPSYLTILSSLRSWIMDFARGVSLINLFLCSIFWHFLSHGVVLCFHFSINELASIENFLQR